MPIVQGGLPASDLRGSGPRHSVRTSRSDRRRGGCANCSARRTIPSRPTCPRQRPHTRSSISVTRTISSTVLNRCGLSRMAPSRTLADHALRADRLVGLGGLRARRDAHDAGAVRPGRARRSGRRGRAAQSRTGAWSAARCAAMLAMPTSEQQVQRGVEPREILERQADHLEAPRIVAELRVVVRSAA